MRKARLLIFALVIFLVGCDVSLDMTEDYIVNSGGAYRGQARLEQNLSDELEEIEDNSEDLEQIEASIENEYMQEVTAPTILSIYSVSIESTNLDNDIKLLENKTHELNGYIKSHDMKEFLDKQYTRTANISIRIPKKETLKLIKYIKERYLITHDSSKAVEVSETYFDLELNIRNLEMQEEHLLNMYEDTNNIEDMLKINERLMEVSREKAKLTSDYLDLQERLEYSIIEVSMHEVANDYNELSAIDKIRNNFSIVSKSIGKLLENILVFIISFSPIILMLIILAISTKKIKNNLSCNLEEEQNNDIIHEEMIHKEKSKETTKD